MSTDKTKGEEMKVVLNVPYISQNSQEISSEWHNRSCGIACVKMLIDFFILQNLRGVLNNKSLSDFIEEGVLIGGFDQKFGWKHDSLVCLLRNHGIMSYRQEFKSTNIIVDDVFGVTKSVGANDFDIMSFGISKIKASLRSGLPVIVSVDTGFNDNKSTHLIVLVGYQNDYFDPVEQKSGEIFYYNDPDSRGGIVRDREAVSLSKFVSKWRKLAIFVD